MEHQEKAEVISDQRSDILKQGVGTTSVASEDTNIGGVNVNPIPNKRERRPAYELKRAHFTFKPTISESPPQKEPSFDPSKYPKPREFFAAYERFLIAQREWQKQTGTFVAETHQYQPSKRPRRPDLPGFTRKRGLYKHIYTDSYLISLKDSEKENLVPSEQSLQKDTAAHVETADIEVDVAHTDKDNLDNILTELLACSPDELDGDAGVKLLEKRLNLKPVDKQMLALPELPEFPDVRRMELKARNLSKPRTALSNIQNLLKGINSDSTGENSQAVELERERGRFTFKPTTAAHVKTADREVDDSLAHTDKENLDNIFTELLACSPDELAGDPVEVQFLFPEIQHLLPGDGQPREVDIEKVITNVSQSSVATVHVASDFNSSVQKSSCKGGSDTHLSPDRNAYNCIGDNIITNVNSAMLEVDVIDMQTDGNEGDVPMNESEVIRNIGRREKDADINEETEQLDIEGEHGEENDNADTTRGLQVENAQEEAHNSSPKQTNKRRKRGSCESNMIKQSKTLHAAGTKWENGVRRSTRIKSRPLEYWRGERFLYGRIHESLPTVVGIKYLSSLMITKS